jgi:hypothetical protein
LRTRPLPTFKKIKIKILRTKIIILLLAGHGALQAQNSQPVSSQPKPAIQCVELTQLPQLSVKEQETSGNVVFRYTEGATFIYTCNKQVLIKAWYQFESAFDKAGKPAYSQQRYRSFVFTKGQKFGSYTDEHRGFIDAKLITEPTLSGEWPFQQQYLYDSIAGGAMVFVDSRRISGTDTLKERYHFVNSADAGTSEDMQLYYTGKAPGSGFSLCPRLDSVKQQRLCRIVYTVKASGGGSQKNQPGSYAISMKDVPVADKDTAAIMAIFRRDKWGKD